MWRFTGTGGKTSVCECGGSLSSYTSVWVMKLWSELWKIVYEWDLERLTLYSLSHVLVSMCPIVLTIVLELYVKLKDQLWCLIIIWSMTSFFYLFLAHHWDKKVLFLLLINIKDLFFSSMLLCLSVIIYKMSWKCQKLCHWRNLNHRKSRSWNNN